jgi:thioredoxin-related protein
MKTLFKFMMIFSIFALLLSPSMNADKQEKTEGMKVKFYPEGKTYDEILKIIKDAGKVGMLYFTKGGCKFCNRLEKEPFSDEDVSAYMNKNFSNFRIHTERNTGPELKKKFAVRSYPTVVFVNQEGEITDRIYGYHPQEKYLRLLEKINKGEGDFASLRRAYEKNPENVEIAFSYAGRLMDTIEFAKAKPIYEKLAKVVKDEKLLAEINKNLEKIKKKEKRRARIRSLKGK